MVLCIQLLPLKQTIAWLLGNQVTEELVHSGEDGKSNPPGDDLSKHFLPVEYPTLVHFTTLHTIAALHHLTVGLPARHADDIPTPPPNC
jgi:hypothetical protein